LNYISGQRKLSRIACVAVHILIFLLVTISTIAKIERLYMQNRTCGNTVRIFFGRYYIIHIAVHKGRLKMQDRY